MSGLMLQTTTPTTAMIILGGQPDGPKETFNHPLHRGNTMVTSALGTHLNLQLELFLSWESLGYRFLPGTSHFGEGSPLVPHLIRCGVLLLHGVHA